MAKHERGVPPGLAGASWRATPLLAGVVLAMLAVSGCAQMSQLKARMSAHFGHHPAAAAAVAPAPAPVAPAPPMPDLSLAQINGLLQQGHYDEAEQALRHYLAGHPGDRPAQAMLRQFTVDPERMLGRQWHPYVVRPGDSYSTLAERFLGDASQFLVLARYNGSTHPSVLRVGQKLRMPAPAQTEVHDDGEPAAAAAPAATADAATVAAPGPTAADMAAARIGRLEQESLQLLQQGRETQALARLDESLAIDRPAGVPAADGPLREKLVAALHQRAIVLYRDQHLDQAIALWDRVLKLDPGYERAVVYRTRALELKHRLQQL